MTQRIMTRSQTTSPAKADDENLDPQSNHGKNSLTSTPVSSRKRTPSVSVIIKQVPLIFPASDLTDFMKRTPNSSAQSETTNSAGKRTQARSSSSKSVKKNIVQVSDSDSAFESDDFAGRSLKRQRSQPEVGQKNNSVKKSPMNKKSKPKLVLSESDDSEYVLSAQEETEEESEISVDEEYKESEDANDEEEIQSDDVRTEGSAPRQFKLLDKKDPEAEQTLPIENNDPIQDGNDFVVDGSDADDFDLEPTRSRASSASKPKRVRRVGPWKPKKPKISLDEELENWHEELRIDWEELKLHVDEERRKLQPLGQPQNLMNVKLLPYQKESLSWFMQQEESKFNGGILADEMGMGKTLQMISLLVMKPLSNPTFVICPVVALYQWKEEIEKYTQPGSLKILIYHGASKVSDMKELLEYDVILSSYAVVESAFRKQQTGFQRKGKKVFEKSLLHTVEWGRIILDEAHCIKDRSCSTARSVFALKSDKKWSLSGTPLQNRVGELYSLIRFMQVSPYSCYYCKKCPCKSMTWKFSDNSHCDECGHKPMQHFCWWNRTVLKPIQKYGPNGDGLVAFQRLGILLDQMMLRRTKLERAEDLGLPPKIVDIRRDNMNAEEEDFYNALYSETRTQFAGYVRAGTVLNHYAHIFELLSRLRQAADHPFLVVHKRASKENPGVYVCGLCHDVCEDPIASKCKHVFCREDIKQYMESYISESSSAECPICFTKLTINLDQETLEPPKFDIGNEKNTASSSIVNRMLNHHSNSDGGSSRWTSSTKIEALVEELTKLRKSDRTIKSIVFSQFVSFLDLIFWRLKRAGFHCVKLDGRMTPQQRDSVIKTFMTVPQVTVFLVSLKAGGVALNLTEASRIFIMDPWWNPAVEDQAMDRIHRLGQRRAVHITRMIVENSIESRIVQLQEKKKLLFQSTVGKDRAALDRLTEEDLGFLFQM